MVQAAHRQLGLKLEQIEAVSKAVKQAQADWEKLSWWKQLWTERPCDKHQWELFDNACLERHYLDQARMVYAYERACDLSGPDGVVTVQVDDLHVISRMGNG